jgi:hypothetical protein
MEVVGQTLLSVARRARRITRPCRVTTSHGWRWSVDSRSGRFVRWLGRGSTHRDESVRWLSPMGAFLWLAVATTFVLVFALLSQG